MSKAWSIAIVLVSMLITPQVDAGSCPGPLLDALRLVLVTTPSMDTPIARMRLFTRGSAGETWIQEGRSEPAVIGHAGLAWGYGFDRYKRDGDPEKVEGDKRTPAGIFRIGPSFGFTDSKLPGHIVLEDGETVCVEDPSSSHYSQIVMRKDIEPNIKVDNMRSTPLYRNGLVVEYSTDRHTRRGSCIFIHVWRASNKGTVGCIAVPERKVLALQQFSRERTALAVLPESAFERFRECLPASAAD
jgi:L,D-peptidoglycan transpeptidase YkuD (ErfK/YbiS/YcfS/YnhG family)